jgi:hypothetical protein
MKKLLPVFLFLGGAIVLGVVFFLIARSTKDTKSPTEDIETVPEVALELRPVASLTPTDDGHWLNLSVDKFKIDAKTMDFELLYSLPDGRSQGVPGSITLGGATPIERKLLLGSESSGKFRYDEGVSEGFLTLKFRNDQGKLVAKFQTKWHLQGSVTELTSIDGKFSYTLPKAPAKTWFITMETFGVPVDAPGTVASGPYGVFTSSKTKLAGELTLSGAKTYRYSTKWTEVVSGSSPDLGIFVGIN